MNFWLIYQKKFLHLNKLFSQEETDNFVEAIQNAGFSEEQIISDSLEKLPSAYEIAKIAEKLAPENVHAFVPNYLKKVEAEEKWLESHEKAENTPDDYVQRV